MFIVHYQVFTHKHQIHTGLIILKSRHNLRIVLIIIFICICTVHTAMEYNLEEKAKLEAVAVSASSKWCETCSSSPELLYASFSKWRLAWINYPLLLSHDYLYHVYPVCLIHKFTHVETKFRLSDGEICIRRAAGVFVRALSSSELMHAVRL